MNIFKKKHLELTEKVCDGKGVYHFYKDCPDISGDIRFIPKGEVIYPLCQSCINKSAELVHNNASDLNKNMPEYIGELFDNIEKSNLPDEEKSRVATKGVIAMFWTQAIYNMLDDMHKEKD